MVWERLKIAYLHGRPGPHWISSAFAESIGAEFYFIDESARWHDLDLPASKRYLRWLQNALRFPYRDFDAVLLDGPHIWPPLGKLIHRTNVPVIPRIANETLYFLYSGYLKGWKAKLMRHAFSRYDAFIVASKMQARLAKAILHERCPPVFTTFNGVPDQKIAPVHSPKSLSSRRILLIAHGPGGWRTWYKGLDLWIETIGKLSYHLPGVEGWVVGQWHGAEIQRLSGLYPKAPVRFLGPVEDVRGVIEECGVYLHLGRGEAWGIAILEAMAMGVPAIVSEWTGAAEAVEQVWAEGIVPLSSDAAAEAVLRYFSLSEAEKRALSEKSQTLIREKY
jgi:glycosyltransferase involved in cell wall biosynthesis